MRVDRSLIAASLCATGALVPTVGHAGGFSVGSQGASALGLGGSATARLDLAEVGFYNPSAWALRPGLHASVGVTAVQATVRHSASDGSTSQAEGVSAPPYLYVAYTFPSDIGAWSVGLSGGVPFGSGVSWGDGWDGRYQATGVAMSTYEAAATVAFAPAVLDGFTAAVGVRYLRSTVALSRSIDGVTQDGHVTIGGEADAAGAQASLGYRVAGLSLGFNYRSRAELSYQGAAVFSDVPVELSGRARDGAARANLMMPDRFAWGAAYRFGAGTVSLDLEHTLWSTVHALVIDFTDPAQADVVQPRAWHDSWTVRAGYEQHEVGLEGLSLRAGVAWDQSPSPAHTLSPSSPDGDRILAALGASYAIADWGLSAHASYAHVFLLDATAVGADTFAGTYSGNANLFSFGLSYALQ